MDPSIEFNQRFALSGRRRKVLSILDYVHCLEGERIPIYVCLMKLTEKGIRNLKDAPKQIEEVNKAFGRRGKVLGFYVTMGEYDSVGIYEAPNDESIMTTLLSLGTAGNVRTTTLKAFTPEEFAEMMTHM